MNPNKPKINITSDEIFGNNIDIETIESSPGRVTLNIQDDNDIEEARFTNKLNKSLDQISENFNKSFYNEYISNSPITLSPNNSDSEYDISESDNVFGIQDFDSNFFHKVSRRDVESNLDKYYDDNSSVKHSNELDVLITYLKGQKNIYIQAKNISQRTLNILLIPSILITSAITIFAPFIQTYSWSGGFISGLNAISTVLISLVNYLKLESSIDIFYHTANQYDKLETGLEFVSSKLLFIENSKERSHIILEKIQDTEKKITEIKEWNSIFVPEKVRYMFPVICNINVFSLIKRMESYKKRLVLRFRDIKNEIRFINCARQPLCGRYEQRLKLLLEVKEKIKTELLCYKTAYEYVDDIFNREIKNAQDYRAQWWWNRSKPLSYDSNLKTNPVVDKYLSSTFSTVNT